MRRVLFGLIMALCVPSMSYSTTYYMRADGTAARGQATSCYGASTAMSVQAHNTGSFQPGDAIVVCGEGGIFREQIVVPSSGSDLLPITYAVSGSPKIYGSRKLSGSGYGWLPSAVPNEWYVVPASGKPALESPHGYVWVNNKPCLAGEVGSLSDGQFAFGDNDGLGYPTVYLYSTVDPNSKSIEASYRDSNFVIPGKKNIVVSGIESRYSGAPEASRYFQYGSIYITGSAANIRISKTTELFNHSGINAFHAAGGTISNVTIDGGVHSYNYNAGVFLFDLTGDIRFTGSPQVVYNGRDGVRITNSGPSGNLTVRGGTYSYNGLTQPGAASGLNGFSTYLVENISVAGGGASHNQQDGLRIASASGQVSIANWTANANQQSGIIVTASGSANIASSIAIQNCTTSDSTQGTGTIIWGERGTRLTIRRLTASGNSTNGLLMEDNFLMASALIESCTFTRNALRASNCGAIWLNDASNTTIRRCWFENNYGSGVILDNDDGEDVSHVTIYSNVFLNTGFDLVRGEIQRAALLFNPLRGHDFRDVVAFGNTINGSLRYGINLRETAGGTVGNLKLMDNIVTGAKVYALRVAAGTTNGTEDFNWNCWFAGSVERPFFWAGTASAFGTYRQLSGQDSESIYQDPLLVSGADVHLTASSPAIGAGAVLGIPFDVDYEGNSRLQWAMPSGWTQGAMVFKNP